MGVHFNENRGVAIGQSQNFRGGPAAVDIMHRVLSEPDAVSGRVVKRLTKWRRSFRRAKRIRCLWINDLYGALDSLVQVLGHVLLTM